MKPDNKPTIDQIIDLERRIAEAEFLIIYACQSGIEKISNDRKEEFVIQKEDIQNIVEAKRTFNTPSWNSEIETNFFISLRTIAQVVDPVSVQSIKSIYYNKYMSIFGVFKVLLLAIANFFVFIFSKLKGINEGDAPTDYFPTKMPKITFAEKITREFAFYTIIIIVILLFFQTKYIIGTGLYQEYEEEASYCELLQDSLKRKAIMSELEINAAAIQLYDSLRDEIFEHQLKKSWIGDMLTHWNKPWKKFFSSLFPEEQNETANIFTGDKVDPDYIYRATKYVLTVLYTYILPILYGLLGGACLILRNLAKEIKGHTLTPDQDIRFYLRLILGALSGLAIGWFFGVEDINNVLTLKALSPLALAFIGGYSVDLLFSLLDGLLEKFSTTKAYSAGE